MPTMTAIMTLKVFQRIYLAVNMARQIADFAGNINHRLVSISLVVS